MHFNSQLFAKCIELTAESAENLGTSCKCLQLSAISGVKCTLTFGLDFSHGLSIERNEFVLVARFVIRLPSIFNGR